MIIEIKVPSVGESVQEAILAEWFKKDGEMVEKDDPLFVIETDKVTLEVTAEASGKLAITVNEGETVAIGAVVGTIDTDAADAKEETSGEVEEKEEKKEKEEKQEKPAAASSGKTTTDSEKPSKQTVEERSTPSRALAVPPSVRRMAAEQDIDLSSIEGTGPGGSLTRLDITRKMDKGGSEPQKTQDEETSTESGETRKPMSPIRRRIASRLLEARQTTAMLTTFNEIDMGNIMGIRSRYKDAFAKKYDVGLGFMSFFTKACVEALKEIPEINAFIDGTDIVYHDAQHIGVAIGSERGLVVPVIRDAQSKSFAEIEQAIVDYVAKIEGNRLELADLEGGTFTISNGGVYGSLLSTPILNTPQSGILGMHKIEKRPVVVNDEIVIRSMMYVALSYDHRIVDGKGAVTFLKRVKEFIETPERMMLGI